MYLNIQLIKDYMKSNNLSEVEFCKMCHINTETLQKFLTDDDSIEILSLFKIAKAIKIHMKDMFVR